jgi:riboflavin kinase/FMN adenylyltransferase
VLEVGVNAQWVLVGDDFRFGRGRQGDLAFLRATARRFSVEAMRTVEVAGERASSTAVRNALAKGELAHAAALLGRNYAISGHVGHGDKRGAASVFRRRTCRCAARRR